MDRSLAEELILNWHEEGVPELIPRAKEFTLPDRKKSVAIYGPRRAGKTFYMYDVISNVLSVPIKDTLFINLEDHRIPSPSVDTLDTLLSTFFELYPEKLETKTYLFLDEVQNVPGWEGFVRTHLDRSNISIFLSGSSSKLLSKEIATSLRGRNISYLVLPFSFKEVLGAKKIIPTYSSKGKTRLKNQLKEYLKYGGFPDVALERTDIIKRKTLRQYVDVMLFRDIVERYNISNIRVLKLLMGQMMASSASLFSANKFHNFLGSQGLKVDKNAIYEYKDHLIDALGFFELKKINGSYRSIQQGLPKIYPIDTGYMTDFGLDMDKNMGRFIETCVAIELLRMTTVDPGVSIHYWRDASGKEVDFVLMRKGEPEKLIQVCFDTKQKKTIERELDGLMKGSVDLKCDHLVIINWDREKEELIDEKRIEFIPLWRWLLESPSP